MFSATNQQRFKLTLDACEHDLHVLGFKGHEGLNQPYRIDIELVSASVDLDLESLLHQPAFLSFGAENIGLHGHIHSAGQGESTQRLTRYQLTLVPRLAYLEHSTQQRIFQNQSVPDIIAQVLKEHGILADA
uniref:contractile injection system protein, VgrG/Pvc8 family n=1 Tax=Pseudomonas sp. QS1027 TaxID=2056244 RepID=UPI002114CFF0